MLIFPFQVVGHLTRIVSVDNNYPYNKYRGKELPPSSTWYSQMQPLPNDSGSAHGSKENSRECSPSQYRLNVGICPDGCEWGGTYDKCVKKSVLKKSSVKSKREYSSESFDSLLKGINSSMLDGVEFPSACAAFNGRLFGN